MEIKRNYILQKLSRKYSHFYLPASSEKFPASIGSFYLFIYIAVFLLLPPHSASSALNDAFPMGYSMQNFGTIMWENAISGRQPWIASAFCRDTLIFGLSAAGTYYYDAMDNMEEQSIRQAAIGIWYRYKHFTAKISYVHFNALDIYREQKGFLSVATHSIPHVSISVELEGYRAGLVHDHSERENIAVGGATVWVPWSFASLSLQCSNIALKDASHAGFVPPFSIIAGIYTAPHNFGAQGVNIKIVPGTYTTIHFSAGQEYWIKDIFGLNLALSTNPLMVAFGATLNIGFCSAYTSFVHHPILGWSKGAGADYVYK